MTKSPRILLFDIETAPSRGYFWGKTWETSIVKIDAPWFMLCFSYKWLGEKKIHTKALCDYPLYDANLQNDFFLVKDLHKLFDEADVLIAHNGDRFDIRKTNARFAKYSMSPPSPYKTIDTLKASRKHFQFESNRLNDLGQYLGFGKKLVTTGFDLWDNVMKGDLKAWHLMKRYNRRDVVLLEKVYNELRPWMTTHPNLQLYHYDDIPPKKIALGPLCPTCQSTNTRSKGKRYALGRVYKQYQCQDCGHWDKGEFLYSASTVRKDTGLGVNCHSCGSPHMVRHGWTAGIGYKQHQLYCKTCGKITMGGMVSLSKT